MRSRHRPTLGDATAAAPDVSGHMFFERRRHLTGIAEQAATRPVAEREGRAALAGEQIMHIGGAETPLLAQRAREREVQPGRKPRPEQLRAGQLCNALGVRSPLGDPLLRRTAGNGRVRRVIAGPVLYSTCPTAFSKRLRRTFPEQNATTVKPRTSTHS